MEKALSKKKKKKKNWEIRILEVGCGQYESKSFIKELAKIRGESKRGCKDNKTVCDKT